MDPNNMLFRLEDLTYELVLKEYGITEERRSENPGLYKQFVEDFIPTREDLEHPIEETKLKELCTRLPCRVLMHRWNPVQDFVDQFTRQGRIQRWAQEKTQKLIVKAVSRYKNECLYSDDEVRKQREREWCERKKENLMRLQLWEYDRRQQESNKQKEKQPDNSSHLDEIEEDDTLQSETVEAQSVITNTVESAVLQIESTPDTPMQPLSQNSCLNLAQITLHASAASSILATPVPTTQNTEELAGREYVEMVQLMSTNSEPILVDYINVNTESMQFGDSTTISQDISNEECTPPYYEFNTHISMTSTQSPIAK